VDAVAANRLQNSRGIGDAVQDVLAAAGKRRAAETERLLDLDRRRELTALRIVPGAAHLFEEEAAEIRDSGAALARGGKKRRRRGLRVSDTELILRVQLLFEGERRCIVGSLGERREILARMKPGLIAEASATCCLMSGPQMADCAMAFVGMETAATPATASRIRVARTRTFAIITNSFLFSNRVTRDFVTRSVS
jgi:hypothetical protein